MTQALIAAGLLSSVGLLASFVYHCRQIVVSGDEDTRLLNLMLLFKNIVWVTFFVLLVVHK